MKAINLHSKHIFRVIFFLIVVPFGKVRNQSLKNTSSVTQQHIDLLNLNEVNYVWIVDRLYSYYVGLDSNYFIESPIFSATTDDTFKWYLRLEPVRGENGKYLYLHLHLSPQSKKSQAWILLDLNIWSDERRTNSVWNLKLSEYLREININTSGWGSNDILRTNEMLSNGKIIISCDIKYSEDLPKLTHQRTTTTTTTTTAQINTWNFNFVDKLASLFNNEKLSDIALIVNGTKYPAHKAILAAHSPIFAKIFERSLAKGKPLKRLNITKITEQAAFEMLRYIYTGKCENLSNIADQLLKAADKYGLDALKVICAEVLGRNLTVENAAKILALANKRGNAELKAKAAEFIASKYIEVSNTTSWKRMAKRNPELVHYVCQRALSCITT